MSFQLLRQMFANRVNGKHASAAGAQASAEKPFKNNLALRALGVGATISFKKGLSAFVLADAAKTVFVKPAGSMRVVAHGKMSDGPYVIHRFYLDDDGKSPEHFLQIIAERGQPLQDEMKLFSRLAEVTPSSPKEWDMWLEGVDGYPPLLGGIKLNWDAGAQGQVEYHRQWGVDGKGEGVEAIEPKGYREAISTGNGASYASNQQAMLYYRSLGSGYEWLQVASVHYKPLGAAEERWIEAYAGIAISPENLQVM